MKVDYIIVGCGLAGIAFCEQLLANNKTFVVFDNNSQQSSTVAGGLYNPVTLKRFTPVWHSQEQLALAIPMYAKIEKRLNIKLDYKIPVRKRFMSLEEQNNWFARSDREGLSDYMSLDIHKNSNTFINSEFGFGEVLETGRIDTKLLILEYKKDLKKKNLLIEESIGYSQIQFQDNLIEYKDISANQIVFAEGYGVKENPFFNTLPLEGSKGELVSIKAPQLQLDYVLKSSVFIIPLGNDIYRIGSTYERTDKTNNITAEAKEALLNKLKTIITCDFEVVDQVAGIRPTVKDRRPLVGRHPKYNNIYVLNGLGTRGVMIGPFVAEQLYNHIEKKSPLNEDLDIVRFENC
ncbi:FAD-binding oxidoreductase [Lacinutrix sp. Bg11-31]|uniref:NAD(P)/FAD-dependent oxidoreductase n=1 Tax=Lacinutrix sp. Bg11-31 TaxID=2057808 RepID=UPI000C304070|nr:FAD-dependent oxidoreductase [Lacinutrix sp. Bg11-31]AUC83557.1 FAD-dependent oxidoreductase [Lacinutrix sp. Bg11-31]